MSKIWRIWGVRHVRWAWHTYRMGKHYDEWSDILGYRRCPAASDIEILKAIWRGEL